MWGAVSLAWHIRLLRQTLVLYTPERLEQMTPCWPPVAHHQQQQRLPAAAAAAPAAALPLLQGRHALPLTWVAAASAAHCPSDQAEGAGQRGWCQLVLPGWSAAAVLLHILLPTACTNSNSVCAKGQKRTLVWHELYDTPQPHVKAVNVRQVCAVVLTSEGCQPCWRLQGQRRCCWLCVPSGVWRLAGTSSAARMPTYLLGAKTLAG